MAESARDPPSNSTRQFLNIIARQRRNSLERKLSPGSRTNPIVFEDDEVEDGVTMGELLEQGVGTRTDTISPSPQYPPPSWPTFSSDTKSAEPTTTTIGVTMVDANAVSLSINDLQPGSTPHTTPFFRISSTSITLSYPSSETSSTYFNSTQSSPEAQSPPAKESSVQSEVVTSGEKRIVPYKKQEIQLYTSVAFPQKGSFWRTTSTSTLPLPSPPEITDLELIAGHIHWNVHGSGHQYWVWLGNGTRQESQIGTTHPTASSRRLQHQTPQGTVGRGPSWVLSSSFGAVASKRRALAKTKVGGAADSVIEDQSLPTKETHVQSELRMPREQPTIFYNKQEIQLHSSATFPQQSSFWRTTSTSTDPLPSPPEITDLKLEAGHIHWNIHDAGNQYWVRLADGTWRDSQTGATHPTTAERRLGHCTPQSTTGRGPMWVLASSFGTQVYRNRALAKANIGGPGPVSPGAAEVQPDNSECASASASGKPEPSGPSKIQYRTKKLKLSKSAAFPQQEYFMRTTSSSLDPIHRPPDIPSSSLKPGHIHWHIHSTGHQYWVRQSNNTWRISEVGTPHPVTPLRQLQHASPNGEEGKGPTWVLRTTFQIQGYMKAREERQTKALE